MAEGRAETIRYHQEFYRRYRLNEPGSWLHRPSPFVLRSVGAVTATGPLLAVDLGCGVGRHSIPVASALPAGSLVIGVDLLPIAATELMRNACEAGVPDAIRAVVADIETFTIAPTRVALLIACSALEHVSSKSAMEQALLSWQKVTRVGGVHCLVIGVDRYEVGPNGRTRPARVEFPLTQVEAEVMLRDLYSGWEWLEYAADTFTVTEERGGTPYRLRSGCLRLLARRIG
jgi:SAM-dependent methyltransferase